MPTGDMSNPKTTKSNNKGKKQSAQEKKMAKIANREARKILNEEAETKWNSYSLDQTAVDANGTMQSICQPNQGVGDTNRIGDEIRLTSIRCMYSVKRTLSTDAFPNAPNIGAGVTRVILFQWNDSATPATDDVLLVTVVGTVRAPYAPYNIDNLRGGKLIVLKDQTHYLDEYNPSGGATFKVAKGFRKKVAYESGSSTGIGKLYFMAISDQGVAFSTALTGESLVTYKDA